MGLGARQEVEALKRIAVRLIQLALTVLVTWLIIDRVGLGMDELRAMESETWTPTAPLLLVGSCLLLLLGYFSSAALWGRIVEDLGGRRLPVPEAVRLFMIANLGRYVPGKVWQIAGLAVLANRKGVSAASATGAAVLGQGIALAAAAAVGVGALLGGPEQVRGWGSGVGIVLMSAVAVGVAPPVFSRVVALWFRLARQEVPEGLGSVHALRWLGLYLVNWVIYAVSFALMVASFGHSGSPLAIGSSFAAAYVLGYVAIFAPAGIGVREGVLVAFLTPHLGVASAGAMAVIQRLWTTAVELVPAAVFWALHVASSDRNDDVPLEEAGE